MGILKKTITAKSLTDDTAGNPTWFNRGSLYSKDVNADYENAYPNAQRIEQAFAQILPYPIDDNGERVNPAPQAMAKIYRPNKSMSAYRFRVALASMYLMHDETYIRVHRLNGQQITADNITGYTFVENTVPVIQDGKRHFYTPVGEHFTEDEVMSIPSGVNPFNVSSGFSPARASRRWTTLEDYLADYQSSFFRNGAIPAGQFIITAPTEEEYVGIMKSMQRAHRGADKSNNVLYSHRPTDEDGQPNAPTIEWVGFDQKNKDLAVKDLVDAVNQKVDKNFGVPAEIQGYLENSNYASVRVAQQIFTEYVIRGMAMEIWDAITHELNRITGGTGFAITYDLDVPVVQDEELIRAQKKQTEAQTIIALQDRGYSLDSIVNALGLDDSYTKLDEAPDDDEELEITESNEDLPPQDPEVIQQTKNLYKQEERITTSEDEEDVWRRDVEAVAQEQLSKHVDSIVADLPNLVEDSVKNLIDTTEEEDEEFRNSLLAVLIPILDTRGKREYQRGQSMLLEAGLETNNTSEWVMTDTKRQRYSEYLDKVADSYNSETAEKARRILAQGQAEGLTQNELRNRLRQMPELDGYRAERLARSEVHRTQGRGSVESMMQIKEETGYVIEKTWRANPSACEYCLALDGTVVDVDKNFINVGDEIKGVDGGTFTNDFVGSESADLHPNDSCRIEYEIRGS